MDFVGNSYNMQMQTQFSGVQQQTMARRTEKQEAPKQQEPVQEQPKKEDVKDTYARGAQDEAPKTHQKKTQQVVQHFVASTDSSKDAKQAQQREMQDARNAQDAQEAGQQQKPQSTPLDNSARIGLMYQQQMRKGRQDVRQQDQNSTQQQQTQLKRFLNNMRDYVKTELNQYTKPEISPYSRRNLREILVALGDETKAFDNKAAKDRRDRQNVTTATGDTKKYNRHFDVQARKDLKLFNDDPMQDPNYDAFQMIA